METDAETIIKTDAKDRQIMSALSENSRIALSRLTKEVKLSRDAVNYRIKRLAEKGAIQSFIPVIDYGKLGFYEYRIFTLIDEEKISNISEFINFLKQNKNIKKITHYHDKWDFELSILARNIIHFDNIVREITNKFPRAVIERDSLATITEYADNAIPEASKKRTPLHTKKENKNNELDEKDFKIIKSLCKDCRQSAYDIGNRINLSPDAVIYRMKKLEDAGIIIKYTVKFNLNKLGYNSYCIGGNMKTFDDRNENRLREFVNSEQNIIGAVKTIGTWEFLLQLAVKIPGEFHAIMKNMKKIFSDSIKNYDVWIVYEENYFNPFPEGVCEGKI